MAKGIIYVMTTVVPGLIKIGKTGIDNYESRMYQLERNGYFNVVGLKRRFAIEVNDYDEKEKLLDEIFAKSNVRGSELFSLDVDLVVQLLSSFEGRQVYPEAMTKEEVFVAATKEHKIKSDWARIPDGRYFMNQNIKGFGVVTATMIVSEGKFSVEKGSICAPAREGWVPEARRTAPIRDNRLLETTDASSPSTAAWIALGNAYNGWKVWHDINGQPIDTYRNKVEGEN